MEIIAAIFLIVVGLIALFRRDILWGLTDFSNQWQGVQSERSELWEARTTLGGGCSLILGIIVLVISIIQAS
jgi:hypothetical protein